MAISRKKKEIILDDTLKKFRDANGIVVTNYQGLTVAALNTLRRELEKVGATYKVIKNTLSKKILKELEINSNFKNMFTGVTGIVFCKDYIKAIKALADFEKKNKVFKIKGGFIEKKVCLLNEIMEISRINSKEELITKLVVTLNSPLQRLANVLDSQQRGLVTALKLISD
ncbi:MAG TPA: 50S ribosomal protein L10, partial [Candidatus Goldiibacteriota bacterium]|nr:50S ribosomal protein L10 [Candidatus Goldiibacteriota bacterium]